MKTNTLVMVGLLGASLAGCEVRCLSPKGNPPPRTQGTGTEAKMNVRLVGYEGADTGEPGNPTDADASSMEMHNFRSQVNAHLARIDAELSGIKKRLDAAGQHARSQLNGTQQDIQDHAERVKKQLQEIGPNSQQTFQSAKKGIADEMNRIDAKIQKLQEALK